MDGGKEYNKLLVSKTMLQKKGIVGTSENYLKHEFSPKQQYAVIVPCGDDSKIFDFPEVKEVEHRSTNGKNTAVFSGHVANKSTNIQKMLPRISNSVKMKKNLFGENILCQKIKTSCQIKKSSQTHCLIRHQPRGYSDDEEDVENNIPCSKYKLSANPKPKMIDADEFIINSFQGPVATAIPVQSPNLTPWSKTKPFVRRPQSGHARIENRERPKSDILNSDVEGMACVGMKLKSMTKNNREACANTIKSLGNRMSRAKSAGYFNKRKVLIPKAPSHDG